MLLAALNLRTAVTSVGPVLDDLERDIGLSSTLAGVLTTLPVISFAALGSLTPRIARRFGEKHTLVGALALMIVGLALRALVHSPWPFLGLSVLALAGGAMGNVLLPVFVKRFFPQRIGAATAGYTTAMATGTTVAAGVTVPLAHLQDPPSWRFGLGAWAALAVVGLVATLVLPGRVASQQGGSSPSTHRPMRHSRTAWALTVFFGAQSMQAYVQFGWFALFFTERAGVSPTRGGVLVAVLAALSIPISMVIPSVAARVADHRALIMVLVGCTVVAYVGMLVAPAAGAWIWVVLAGIGAGAFPLALTMIGMRTRSVATTGSLSAFAQSIGYVIAGAGPLLVGVLHGVTGGWTWPFVLLFADLGVMAAAGWVVGQHRYVEDDLVRPPA
ncbi:MAG TPA: MFS transporter [Actinomycetales bacterium]|nr:MFS transporter [Actinomycetales bacterium]